jgi:hypothetical protein
MNRSRASGAPLSTPFQLTQSVNVESYLRRYREAQAGAEEGRASLRLHVSTKARENLLRHEISLSQLRYDSSVGSGDDTSCA